MKMSKRAVRGARPAPMSSPLMIMDEFHALPPVGMNALRSMTYVPSGPSAILTQAIVRRNSGKRVRLISYTKWANGEPMARPKKKFLPLQVLRRQEAAASKA